MPRKSQDTKQVRFTVTLEMWRRAEKVAACMGLPATNHALAMALGLGISELEQRLARGEGEGTDK